jgi:MinD superfamily P-loop ATPase
MKQLVVISGKGGTGKTSIVASFARFAARGGSVVMADCDVDAPNLSILLPGDDEIVEPFYAGRRGVVDETRCIGCYECAAQCRFSAITVGHEGVASINSHRCEGCGVCSMVCPADAITFRRNQAGLWFQRQTEFGPLVHASLGVAQDNSGKLVAHVRQRARDMAERRGSDLVIIDGPPGIGCPVHAAISGCDLAVIVTEPTPSGEHDLERVLQLTGHFKVPSAITVNKADLNSELTDRLRNQALAAGSHWLGVLPFDASVPKALASGRPPNAVEGFLGPLLKIWNGVRFSL